MKKFNDIYKNFISLRQRMDDDLIKRYYLGKFILTDKNGKELDNSTSITLNDARVFGDACMYVLGEDKQTWEIIGVDAFVQSTLEKKIIEIFYNNDLLLERETIEPLDSCENFFDLFRGYLGALPLIYEMDGKYCPTILPLDPRWMTWEIGARGIEWGSYRVRMSKDAAGEKYGKKFGSNDVEIENVWDKDNWYTFEANSSGLVGEPLKTIGHKLGLCPIVIVPVPTQPLLIASGETYDLALAKQGESIYAPVRDIIGYMNEYASIWASINKQQFLAPLTYTGERSELDGKPFGWGTVTFLKPGETLEELRRKEVSPSTQALFAQLFSRFEVATMTRMGLGGNPPIETSALLGAQLRSDRDKIFGCRRKAKTTFYRKVTNILRRQINGTCYKTEFDEEDSIEIDKELWKDKFMVNITFASVSPEESITNLQTAAQAANIGVPRIDLFTNYMHVDDPYGMDRRKYIQDAEAMIPALALFNAEVALTKGNATQDEINQARAEIIADYLDRQAGTGEINQVPNVASQAKTTMPMTESSQVKSKRMAKQTGNTVEAKGLRR